MRQFQAVSRQPVAVSFPSEQLRRETETRDQDQKDRKQQRDEYP
jgi:hypothetical protein